jgi:eukaryotic-like serine/threonine-protein kinase
VPLTPGTRVGPYEILAPTGVGSLGDLYRARHLEAKREVALEVLPDSLTRDATSMDRLQRDVQTLASIKHPNIAAVFGIEQNAIVMELVPSLTLEERIAAGPLSLHETLAVAKQIASALETAHENGVVHHDLKSASVRVSREGGVKVLDFQAGSPSGTPGYMSPEQAAGKPVDKSANVWTFGALLYEMLTGLRPGEAQKAPVDLSHLPADTPASVRWLVGRCLEREARHRLRTMSEARAAVESCIANPAAAAEAVAPAAPRLSRRVWWAATAAALAVAALGFVVTRKLTSGPVRAEVMSVAPLNERMMFQDDGFAGAGVAVSPDGNRVVFPAVFGGVTALWLRELDQPNPKLLEGTEGAAGPFWSPDGRNIGFSASGKLKRIPLTGGAAVSICDVGYSTGASWNKDDVIIYGTNDGGVFRVPAGGGTPAPVTGLDKVRGEDSHRYPWFLPDGRHFLYTARLGERRNSSVYVGDLESKERRLVFDVASNAAYAEPGYVLFAIGRTLMAQPFDVEGWRTSGAAVPIAQNVSYSSNPVVANFGVAPDGTLAYTSTDVGIVQLTWFDRAGKVLGAVGPPGGLEFFSLSPDEKAIVVPRNNTETWKFDLWQYGLTQNTETRFTFTGHSRFPVWSSDGKNIAFNGSQGGVTKLYQKPAIGGGDEEVLEAADKIPADWSRDGRYLITMTGNQTPVTGNDIWVLPLFGDRKPYPYLNSKANEFFARLSPDGKWMAYASNESKRYEVYVAGFPTSGEPHQVSNGGGSRPVWSRNGKELYYMSPAGKVMAVEIKTAGAFQATAPKPLFTVRFPFQNHNFDVTKDGRFLIPVLVDQSAVPMTVVHHWTGLLKEK